MSDFNRKEPTMTTPAALAAAMAGDISSVLTASTPGGIERQEKAAMQAKELADYPQCEDVEAYW